MASLTEMSGTGPRGMMVAQTTMPAPRLGGFMESIDYDIILIYLVALAAIGIWLAWRATETSDHYFLGGRAIPWWALGASGMASNLDVAGTMTVVALIYSYGLQGFFIELRGGVVLPIAVFLAFMGKWHRRSVVMTTAEWMILRFGAGVQGRAARFTAAATYLVITIAMIVFFFTAGGKFLAEFLPFSALQCTLGMALIAFGYTLVGGLYGVVWTDVLQAAVIGGAAVYLAVIAAQQVTPELLAAWPGAAFNSFTPAFGGGPGLKPYEAFGWFLCVWATKGVLEGLGGSGGSAYMAQRFYAARTDAECQKIGILWTILFAFRWPMVLGFAILAVKLGGDAATASDPERVLPLVLKSHFFPPGVRGLMIAALLAAAMSTFDSTINAGASYIVKDIYEPLLPKAAPRQLVFVGYLASALIVIVGLVIALLAGASVLGVWVNIVMLLFPAFLVPFALRWYWSRFNGAGFTAGVISGFAAAFIFFWWRPSGWNEAQQFLAIATGSLVVSVASTLATAPVPAKELRIFFERVAPFGFWPREWLFAYRTEHRRDFIRVCVALVWQLLTFLIPMGLVLGLWTQVALAGVLWIALFSWLIRDVKKPVRSAEAEMQAFS
jgi:SSS family solute:Na+ symporter